jgi:CelD/BcsL family acetyltransferase involved in cellulose biosynthesis
VDTNPDIARVVIEAMRGIAGAAGLSRFGFINVPDGSPTAAALSGAGLNGFHLDTRYYMDLAALRDWDGYLATLSSKDRREYRRHLRRGEECGVKVVERPAAPGEDPQTLRIFEETMARVGSAGYYSAERIAAFLAYTPRGARVIDVLLDGDVIAKAIVFVETHKIHAWAAGYDRDRPLPFSSYYVLIAAIIQLGFQLGLPRLEMGRRNPKFKERFGMPRQELSAFMADA